MNAHAKNRSVAAAPASSNWRSVLRVDTLPDFLHAARNADAPVILNTPPDKLRLEALCTLLGRGVSASKAFGEVREIRHDPDNLHSLAESLEAHPPHTDGTFMELPPSAFMLHFVVADPEGGGVSTFMPLYDLLASLEPNDILRLSRDPVRFARRDRRGFVDAWEGVLLSHDPWGRWRFRWRYDDQVFPVAIGADPSPLDATIAKLRRLTQEALPMTYAARAGDLVWVPNETWLHGRTALSPASPRLVFRAWIA